MNRFAVIMAGGSGTRFWPKSSSKKPKQLLALTGKKTQIELTWDRLNGLIPPQRRWIICTAALARATSKILPTAKLLKEPEGRNTMAAVCWSAWAAFHEDESSLVAVMPADAHVADVAAFRKSLNTAYEVAALEERIVCLGIKPTHAATGYGYIQGGAPLAAPGGSAIERFVEKPDSARAAEFYESGKYFWNAGIFVFPARTLLDEVRRHAPEFAAFFDANVARPAKLKAGYKRLVNVSFDVALMEKTGRGALVSGDFGWNDIGSWTALPEVLAPNSEAGLIRAPAGFEALECRNLVVDAKDKFVGLIGVSDLIIVETDQALLVCHKDKAQKIKELVASIGKNRKLKRRLL